MMDQNERPSGVAQKNFLTLTDLWVLVYREKFLVISLTIIASTCSIFYSLSLEDFYQAEATLIEAEQKNVGPSLGTSMGGIAGLAGLEVKSNAPKVDLAMTVLTSRKFIRDFIFEREILSDLVGVDNKEFDSLEDGEKEALIQSAVRALKGSFHLALDPRMPVFKLTVTRSKPEITLLWINWLVEDLNKVMKEEEVNEAKKSIEFLQEKALSTSVSDLRTLFFSMIETHTRTIMLAEVRKEFIFKVIDPAVLPLSKAGPDRSKIVIWGTLVGGFLSIFLLIAPTLFGYKLVRRSSSFLSLRLENQKDL